MQERHPIDDLHGLAQRVLQDDLAEVRHFAAVTAEALLLAQARTGTGDLVQAFRKVPFADGTAHSGGVLTFRCSDGRWQIWRLKTGAGGSVGDSERNWALTAAWILLQDLRRAGQALSHVSAHQFHAADGTTEGLGTWNASAIGSAFEHLRTGPLARLAQDLTVHPGAHCSGCSFAGACPATPVVRDLLRGVRPQPRRVKVSPLDLRTHAACPWRYHLQVNQGLPGTASITPAMQRGADIDQWLTAGHSSGRPCTDVDVAALTDVRLAGLAAQHVDLCPVPGARARSIRPHPAAVAIDEVSDVLLVSRPDLAYTDEDGHAIWRETKTGAALRTTDPMRLVSTDVTAAMYLILLEAMSAGSGVLEWEQLTPTAGELTVLDAADTELVDAARTALSAAVADLVSDELFAARPGQQCDRCPQAARCRARA